MTPDMPHCTPAYWVGFYDDMTMAGPSHIEYDGMYNDLLEWGPAPLDEVEMSGCLYGTISQDFADESSLIMCAFCGRPTDAHTADCFFLLNDPLHVPASDGKDVPDAFAGADFSLCPPGVQQPGKACSTSSTSPYTTPDESRLSVSSTTDYTVMEVCDISPTLVSNLGEDTPERSKHQGIVPQIPGYQRRFQTFEAAHNATMPTEIEEKVHLILPNDDWQVVKTNLLQHFASRIYEALADYPGEAPPNFEAGERSYYDTHQQTELKAITARIRANSYLAEARAMLMVEHIVHIHEHGLPQSMMNGTTLSRKAYSSELMHTCSQRVEQVIAAIRQDKYIAGDVLAGVPGLQDLARAPTGYLKRKQANSKVNARKAIGKKMAEEFAKHDGAGEKIQTHYGGRNTAGKRAIRDDDNENGADHGRHAKAARF